MNFLLSRRYRARDAGAIRLRNSLPLARCKLHACPTDRNAFR